MNSFKRNIYKTKVEISIPPPEGVEHLFAGTGSTNPVTACTFIADDIPLYSSNSILGVGSILYTDIAMTTLFDGNGWNWHTGGLPGVVYQITNLGVITNSSTCT